MWCRGKILSQCRLCSLYRYVDLCIATFTNKVYIFKENMFCTFYANLQNFANLIFRNSPRTRCVCVYGRMWVCMCVERGRGGVCIDVHFCVKVYLYVDKILNKHN